LIKSVAGIATLLNEGIGDTIRLSLTADPVEESKAGRALLEYLGLRERTTLDFIACPSCGRAEVDVIKVANEANERLGELGFSMQVAVMGCVVNGPGEAREADLGLAAGKGRGHLFIKGEVVRVVPEAEMVDALIAEAKLIDEEGTEARLAAADVNAADIAEETALELRSIQGDVNRSEERKASVADVASGSDTD
jgi:(E)-4-hydroxy-3-methylbut-2-enyl-diphosphate synthase